MGGHYGISALEIWRMFVRRSGERCFLVTSPQAAQATNTDEGIGGYVGPVLRFDPVEVGLFGWKEGAAGVT